MKIKPPVKQGDNIVMQISGLGSSGEGVGKYEGFTVFVKGALPEEEVRVTITLVKKSYAVGALEEIVKASAERVEPACPVYKECGGCQLQSVDYKKQLDFKQNKVINDLIRIGGFDPAFIHKIAEPIIGMDAPFFYRNKAQYPIGMDKEGRLIAGFYAGRTHSIIANTDCKLGLTINQPILETILKFMQEMHIPAYDETLHTGLVRHVLIRSGFATGEVMICLVINGVGFPKKEELIRRLTGLELGKWKITSICTSSNTKDTNVIMGDNYEVLYGNGYITDKIGDVAFRISPLSFYQVNPVQTRKLYETALAYANLTGSETVWDLYCGIGTISLFLAQKAGMVHGVEIIPQAIDNAKENAKINGIENAAFYVGKAEEVLPKQFEENHIHADVIVVDPPRKGCDEKCLETMVQMAPERIVYVSCDPATLARDLKYLCGNGYCLERVQAVDQFPETVHVETVCLLSKKCPV